MTEIETGRAKDDGYSVKVDDPNPDTKAADQVTKALRKWTKRLGEKVARDDTPTAQR